MAHCASRQLQTSTAGSPTVSWTRRLSKDDRKIPKLLSPRAYWRYDGHFIALTDLLVEVGSVRIVDIDIVKVHRDSATGENLALDAWIPLLEPSKQIARLERRREVLASLLRERRGRREVQDGEVACGSLAWRHRA